MKKNRKLFALIGMLSLLVVGTVVTIATKKEVKAEEINEEVEVNEELEDSKGLTEYFRKIKMSECDITLEADTFNWSGQVITPTVNVVYEGQTLIINKDYTLKYSDNIDSGVATVKVKGKGNYRGSEKLEFTIKGTDIATECTFELVDEEVVMMYNGEVVDASEYDYDWYYIDTFVSDTQTEATYIRTTFHTVKGKGRFEGTYELRSERTYVINGETGEITFK